MSDSKKVVLITGASSEIGSVIVRELLAANFQVYGHVNSNPNILQPWSANSDLKIIQHDLSTLQQAGALIERVFRDSGKLDVLINAIGPFQHKRLNEISPNEWHDQIHFNLSLPFYMTYFAKEHLIRSQGHIINFAFAGADAPKSWANSTACCAAKVGLVVLTKSMATLLGPHQVRVNLVSPGLIETGDEVPSEERKRMSDQIPLGRPGTPNEVAQVVLWLLKTSPAYITGASIPISGGWEFRE